MQLPCELIRIEELPQVLLWIVVPVGAPLIWPL